MREIGERYLRKIYYNLKTCALWLFMAGLTGVGVGAFSSAFSFCLKKVTFDCTGQHFFICKFYFTGQAWPLNRPAGPERNLCFAQLLLR